MAMKPCNTVGELIEVLRACDPAAPCEGYWEGRAVGITVYRRKPDGLIALYCDTLPPYGYEKEEFERLSGEAEY